MPKPAWLLKRVASPRRSARRASRPTEVRGGSSSGGMGSPARAGRAARATKTRLFTSARTTAALKTPPAATGQLALTGATKLGQRRVEDLLDQDVVFDAGRGRRLRKIVLLGQRWVRVGLQDHQ